MGLLIEIINLAGNWIVYVLDVVEIEPDPKDAFW